MKITQKDLDDLIQNDTLAWKRFFPVFKKCARYGAVSARAEHLSDDVMTELVIVSIRGLLSRINVEYHLEPILVETSRRIALAMKRSANEGIFIQNDHEEDGEHILDNHAGHAYNPTEQVNLDIDAKRALERFNPPPVVKKTYKPREQYEAGDLDLADALRHERHRRGWTQKQMAAYLGLKVPTYISYEHACVLNPKPAVREMLHKLQFESLTVE